MTDTPAAATTPPAQLEQRNATTPHRAQNPASGSPLQPEPTSPSAEHESTASTAAVGLSISTNAVLGFIGALVTLFGSAIIGLMLYTLNSLNDRITTVETSLNDRITTVETSLNDRMDAIDNRLSELSQQQVGMDKTLSVLIAILNARSEVEAAKAHQITPPD